MQAPVSVVVIHYASREYTDSLVKELSAHCDAVVREIVIVDNASPTPYVLPFESGKLRLVRLDESGGYGAACNKGAENAAGQYILILNDDLQLGRDFITPLIQQLEADPAAAVAAPRLLSPNGTFQLSYGEDPTLISEFHERRRQKQARAGTGNAYKRREEEASRRRSVDWVTGAALLIRMEVFRSIDGFDERYFFYFEDADLCRRVRIAGWSVLYCPETAIVHIGGGSNPSSNPLLRKAYRMGQLRYYARYNGRISFCLLKIYLIIRAFARFPDSMFNPVVWRDLIQAIRSFSFSSVAASQPKE